MTLTEAQCAAVEREGQDVCVIAGPGSGKTRVLVARYEWLVRARGVDPARILAVTFTEKAAHEMKTRLVEAFAADEAMRRRIERAWILTIDAFCARLLREHALEAGVAPEFEILDERLGDAGARQAAEAVLDRLCLEKPAAMRALLDAWPATDPVEALVDTYNRLRSTDVAIDRTLTAPPPDSAAPPYFHSILTELDTALDQNPVAKTPAQRTRLRDLRDWRDRARLLSADRLSARHFDVLNDFGAIHAGDPCRLLIRRFRDSLIPAERARLLAVWRSRERTLLAEIVEEFDRAWTNRKRATGVLDFADLEHYAVRLLETHKRVHDVVRGSFDAVLMDECQDTNRLQARLVELLRRPGRFFAVGDINQSIFGFRHADPEVFREYRDGVTAGGGVIDHLNANFRSPKPLLDAVSRVLGGAEGIEPFELDAARESGLELEPAVELLEASTSGDEADAVARRILEITARQGVGMSSIAILVRSTPALDVILPVLATRGIPYLLTKGRNFYQARETLDLLHLLRALADERDEISLAAVLRSPLCGASDEALLRLKLHGGLTEALLDPAVPHDTEDARRLGRFRALFTRLRVLSSEIAPDRLLGEAIDDCDYLGGLDWRARGNVEKFLSLMRGMWTAQPRGLPDLVREIEIVRAAHPEPEAPPVSRPDAVQVMTIHAAKGLEFPIVFVPALERGVANEMAALAVSPRHGLGARWRDPATGEPAGDEVWERIRAEEQQREREEANRLLFVAMTRAEQRLILSWSRQANWAVPVVSALAGGVVAHRTIEESALRRPLTAVCEEDDIDVLPAPDVRHEDGAAAVTDVALFSACPRRYFLERYIGLDRAAPPGATPGDATGGPGLAARGKTRFLAVAARQRVEATEPRAKQAVCEDFNHRLLGAEVHALLAGAPVTAASAEAREMAEGFETSSWGQRLRRAVRVEREFDIVFAIGDLALRGRIDLWFEEGGELVVLDYKTDAEPKSWHVEQARLYAMAVERIIGRIPDRAVVFYLRTGRAVPAPLDALSLDRTRSLVRDFVDAQSRQQFPLREGEQCLRCPFYWGACPAALISADPSRASSSRALPSAAP